MDSAGIAEDRRVTVLRALDKYDRLGENGVRALLGKGRKDESGDYTRGADLDNDQINHLMMLFELNPQSGGNLAALPEWEQHDSSFVYVEMNRAQGVLTREILPSSRPGALPINNHETIKLLGGWFGSSPKVTEALNELDQIAKLAAASRYGSKRIRIDPSV